MQPVRTLMRALYGSQLYGTATPQSDTDYKSVHLPSGRAILLGRPEMTLGKSGGGALRNTAADVDDESFSLAKFFQMLAAGDMLAIELLFVPAANLLATSPEWESLVARRGELLHRDCAGFVGYVQRQAAKYGIRGSRIREAREALALLEGFAVASGETSRLAEHGEAIERFVEGRRFTEIVTVAQADGRPLPHLSVCDRKLPYTVTLRTAIGILSAVVRSYGERALNAERDQGIDWKSVMHALRVGEQAVELLQTGKITFPRPNADELRRIRAGGISFKEIGPRLDQLLQTVEEAGQASTLRAAADQDLLTDILLQLHLGQVRKG